MENDEIDLVDYIRVILKRKWVIVLITLGAMIVTGILSYFLPKSYKISAILEIGKIGDFTPETSSQLQEKINQGSYNEFLKEKIGLTNIPEIEASALKDTNLIIIETTTKNLKKGEELLRTLSDIIVEEHGKLISKQKKIIQEEIKKEELKLSILEKSKNLPELQYLYVEHLSRIDELKNTISTAVPTRLIKAPTGVSTSQNILFNIIIAGVLGIFIGTLSAFFQEFLEKNKERLKG